MMIPNDVTMLEKVVFIGFLSFYAGLVIILWLTDMKFRKLTKGYSGFAKMNVMICYSQTVHGKLSILNLFSIHLYIVTFITFIYFLKIVQFAHYFFQINFWYYLDNHLFKKVWTILGLILVVFTKRFIRMFFVLLQFLLP